MLQHKASDAPAGALGQSMAQDPLLGLILFAITVGAAVWWWKTNFG